MLVFPEGALKSPAPENVIPVPQLKTLKNENYDENNGEPGIFRAGSEVRKAQ